MSSTQQISYLFYPSCFGRQGAKGDAVMAASREEIESYYVAIYYEKIQQGSSEEETKSSSAVTIHWVYRLRSKINSFLVSTFISSKIFAPTLLRSTILTSTDNSL